MFETNQIWDAQTYKNKFGFVHEYGEDLFGLLEIRPGTKILDLGCGSGALTKKLAELGADVVGIDASEEMLKIAKKDCPDIPFYYGDGSDFSLEEKFDAVFSNAVFHWIENQDGLLRSIADVLNPGGFLVCEFGGHGNCALIHKVLEKAFADQGLPYRNTFYFPTVGAYAGLLEAHGYIVRLAQLFDRPTKLQGENGMRDWIELFIKTPFETVPDETKAEIIRDALELLRPALYKENSWYADYVRIRLKAEKR